ncbi:MAG: glycosyltransferase [Pseudomonadota bacterium]
MKEQFDVSVYYAQPKSDSKGLSGKELDSPDGVQVFHSLGRTVAKVNGFDLVIIGGWGRFDHRIITIVCKAARVRCAVFSDQTSSVSRPPFTFILRKHFVRLHDFFFIAGETAAENFAREFGLPSARVFTFPYAHNDRLRKIDEDNEIPSKCSRSADVKVFVANRFIPRKGYGTLYNALRILQDHRIAGSLSFSIAGTGPELEFWRSKFSSLRLRLNFVGWVSEEIYDELLTDCDIYIHASDFEPYGIPVVDATMRLKRVISTTGVYSALDLKRAGVPIRMITPGDFQALADHLVSAANEKELPQTLVNSDAVQKRIFPIANLKTLQSVLEK